jgi:predicted ATPase/DNA-binding CsgD family transcriptional regulator
MTVGHSDGEPADMHGLVSDVAAYLSELARLAQAAAGGETTTQAIALAHAQRVAAWGLHAAVAEARTQGSSWRELADALDVSPATLHRQYQTGAGLTVPVPSHPDVIPVGAAGQSTDHLAEKSAVAPTAGVDLFVGRDLEMADLPVLLRQRRLVTLLGPGGVGKSRLAVELIQRVRRSFRGGILWVELAAFSDPAFIDRAIAASAGAAGHSTTTGDLLTTMCRTGPVLLVLDNCEHLVDAAAKMAAGLLADHPKLRVLTTSRERLQIPGEAEFGVQPLPAVPVDPADPRLRLSAAFRLFMDRAQAVPYDIHLADHARVIAELCNGLDGLPLAIELAARQAAVLPPKLLLERFADRLDLLTGGPRNGTDRQRTLRGTIEWSYRLLDATEQAVFRRLALLPGGFDQQMAAAAVADLGLGRAGLWALLAGLAGKSLLVTDSAGIGRLRMLESLRAVGMELLDRHHERDLVDRQIIDSLAEHAVCQAAIVWANAAPELRNRTLDEHDNIRCATDAAARLLDPRHSLLANLLATCWTWRTDYLQASELLRELLHDPQLPDDERTKALLRLSVIASETGDFPNARQLADQGLAIARRIKHEVLTFKGITTLIYAHQDQVDTSIALDLNYEQVNLLRTIGSAGSLARSLNGLAWLLMTDAQLEAADAAATEAIELMDGEDAEIINTAGVIALHQNALDTAAKLFLRALEVVPHEQQPAAALESLEGHAVVAARHGENSHAAYVFAATSWHRDSLGCEGDPWWTQQIAEAHAVATSMLAESTAAKARREGEAWTLEETIAYARSGVAVKIPISDGTPLTRREHQVVDLLVAGNTIAQIAVRLSISARTVDNHLVAIRTKLGLPNALAVVAWATTRRVMS